MKISIAGTGYVGLVTAVCLASKGHQVTCVDIDAEKIAMLKSGRSPIYEPGLEELMKQYAQNLRYTTNAEEGYRDAEVVFIGVGTPEKRDGSANLSYVFKVAETIANSIENDCIIVIKSTVPVGTNDRIEEYITKNLKNKIQISVASNPEFLSQGSAVHDTLYASRIILGVESDDVEKKLRKVYENFDSPILVTNRRSAEMIKYASNDFLALKISYINEVANLCEEVGADIEAVTAGMGYDYRIGKNFLNAGIGYGGSCFPKDTKALNWLGNLHDKEIKTIKAAIEVNEQQKLRLYKKSRRYYDSLKSLTVAVLGVTFKPETDDLREAPSLVNVPMFLEEGAYVKLWDPIGIKKFKSIIENINCEGIEHLIYCKSIEDTIKDADICFIFTEWKQIKNIDPQQFILMKKPIILDGRNCFSLEKMEGHPLVYDSIGRRRISGI